MKSIALICLLSLSLFAQKVIELPLEKSKFVTLKVMFQIGSINDPKGKEGLTYLTATLLNSGETNTYSLKDIGDLLFPMGTGFGYSVDKEAVVFTGTVHIDHLDTFYDIFKSTILDNKFAESDFNRIKSNQLNYVKTSMINTNDEALSKYVLEAELFKGHPYAHPVEGLQGAVESLTLDDVKAQFKSYFTKNNLVLGIAGNYSAAFLTKVKNDFFALSDGKSGKINLEEIPMPKGIETTIVSKPKTFGSALFMGFPMDLTRAKDDFAAMMVANSYFGEHRKSYSLLYEKMREERSLNYGDYSYIEWYEAGDRVQLPLTGTPRRSNYFAIWIRPVQIADQLKNVKGIIGKSGEFITDMKNGTAQPELGQAHFVLRQSLRELKKLVDHGLSQEDFDLTRDFIRGYSKQFIRNQSLRLGYLMDSYAYGREDFIMEMDALLAKLTRDDVNKAIKKYLQYDHMKVAIITSDTEAEKLAESIKMKKISPIIYKEGVFSGMSDQLLDEDKEIMNFDYNAGKTTVISSDKIFN
jgi:zinc protease